MGYVRMRARVRVRMVTDSGQREGVRGCRTGEQTAGQQETRTAGTDSTGDSRRAGGQDSGRQGERTRNTGTETAGQEREHERTAERED